MELNPLDITEVQNIIFTKLGLRDLQSCRQVGSSWNQEIISHNKLKFIVDSKQGNLNFIRKVMPKSLEIHNLKKLLNQDLAQVKELAFKFSYDSKPRIQIHKFSEAFYMLSVLEFHRPILASFDMEEKCGKSIGPNTLFNNLNTLSISHVEDRYEFIGIICDFQQIKMLSKNICYLLKTIGTLKLKINADFWDINSSLVRNDYRFEDVIMLEFISSQLNLKELSLIAQITRSDSWSSTVRRTYPAGLRYIDIRNRKGSRSLAETQINIPDIFGRNLFSHYFLIRYSKYSDFWRELLSSQTKLEKLYFQHEGNFGNAKYRK